MEKCDRCGTQFRLDQMEEPGKHWVVDLVSKYLGTTVLCHSCRRRRLVRDGFLPTASKGWGGQREKLIWPGGGWALPAKETKQLVTY